MNTYHVEVYEPEKNEPLYFQVSGVIKLFKCLKDFILSDFVKGKYSFIVVTRKEEVIIK